MIVDGFKIGLRVRLPIFITVIGEFVLPSANIGWFDSIQRELSKVRNDFQINQKALVGYGRRFQTLFLVSNGSRKVNTRSI